MKASESNTEVSLSWRKMHSRVGVTFPALILARLHLCRLVCYSDLSHVVLRPHYPCVDMETTLDHSEKITGAGCRETSLDPSDEPKMWLETGGGAWNYLLRKAALARRIIRLSLLDVLQNATCIESKRNETKLD
jgi:hypothetical protein